MAWIGAGGLWTAGEPPVWDAEEKKREKGWGWDFEFSATLSERIGGGEAQEQGDWG